MGRAGQIVWRVLCVLLALGLLLALLALAAWWGLPRLPPSEAQRGAMALMRDAPEPTGRNAWAAVWFLNKTVPEDQMLALAEADVADWQALLCRGDVSAQVVMDWRPPSDANFRPELPFDDERPPLCESAKSANGAAQPEHKESTPSLHTLGQVDCLAAVRAQPARYAQWLNQRKHVLDRIAALDAYGYYRFPGAARAAQTVYMPWPQLVGASMRQAAMQQLQGDSTAASDTICRQVQRMRKLYTGSGDLILHMLLAAEVRNGAQLLSAIWAEGVGQVNAGASASVPDSCQGALAALTQAEGTMCDDMPGEFLQFSRMLPEASKHVRVEDEAVWYARVGDWLAGVGFVPAAGEALWAELAARNCQASFQQQMMAGVRDLPVKQETNLGHWLRHGTAGILAPMAVIAYEPYIPRLQDMNAQHTALRTVRWLHLQAGAQELLVNALVAADRDDAMRVLQQLVDERPQALRLQDRPFTVVADASGVYLQMDLFQEHGRAQAENPHWALPLALPKP